MNYGVKFHGVPRSTYDSAAFCMVLMIVGERPVRSGFRFGHVRIRCIDGAYIGIPRKTQAKGPRYC